MARGVVYDSLAALVDYLQQEEEDRAVPISALADVLSSEGAVGQTVRGLNDLRRQAGQGMMGLGEDIEGSRSMQAKGDLEEMATIPGHMLANTLQAGGYLTQFGADDWQDVKRAAGAVADKAVDPETWRERPGPLGESYPGLFYDAAEAVQPYLDKPYKVAQEMGVGEVLPGAGILAKLGMAVGPMGKAAKLLKGDKDLRLPDFADEVIAAGGQVDEDGFVRLFHRTTPEKAEEIRRTGQMVGKEDGIFFSTSPVGQAEGYGESVVEVRLPLSDLQIDDLFDSEAHLRLPLKKAGDRVKVEVVVPEEIPMGKAADLARKGSGGDKKPGEITRQHLIEEYNRHDGETIDVLTNKMEEISKELQVLNKKYAGIRVPPEVSAEWNKLNDEWDWISEKLSDLNAHPTGPSFGPLGSESSMQSEYNDKARRRLSVKEKLQTLERLPDVEKERLDRAVEQGFQIDAFHGTHGDITEFDPAYLGMATDAPSARLGFFFSADAETASNYASGKDWNLNPRFQLEVQELKDKIAEIDASKNARIQAALDAEFGSASEKAKTVQDRIDVISRALAEPRSTHPAVQEKPEFKERSRELYKMKGELIELRQELGAIVGEDPDKLVFKRDNVINNVEWEIDREKNKLLNRIDVIEESGGNVMPVKLRLQNPYIHDFEHKGYRDVTYHHLLTKAKEEGHDGAIFKNTNDGGPLTDVYIVFDESQIRSRFAKFDPKKAPESITPEIARQEIAKINQLLDSSEPGVSSTRKERRPLLARRRQLMEAEHDRGGRRHLGTGDVLAGVTPIVMPLGVGTAAAAYLANQEQE